MRVVIAPSLSTTRRSFLAGASILFAAPSSRAAVRRDPSVACRAGRFIGVSVGGVAEFRGIQYGKATRFQAPVPLPPTNAPVRAVSPGPACPQRSNRHPQSENCLTLNIWTPTADPRARRPVMVWIHGGAYSFGSANDPITDGRRLAEAGDAVVVTVNHRLNAFGYLYLGRLDPRFPDSGNAGQLDLKLALAWIRDNISAFGGDPNCVTLFGQSGGGAKIATLMAMPSAKGLFQRAITMSGQQVTISGPVHATARARAFMARLRVNHPAQLVDLPAESLLEALAADDPIERSPIYMGPVLDGRALPRHPFWPDPAPSGLGVPLMLGSTRDEMRAFSDPLSGTMRDLTWSALPERIAAELPVDLAPETIIAAYRLRSPGASPADIFYAATTDGRSWRPFLIEAEARASAGHAAYVYEVDFTSPTKPERGAFHGIDIGLVFGTLDAPDAWTGTGDEARRLSREMQDRFVAFARSGDPNVSRRPYWPTYDKRSRATMIFDRSSRVVRDPRQWQREQFAPVPYTQPGT